MSKAKPIEQKKGRPIREIKMVGRDFFVEMQMGRACPVVVITPAEFNRMMDMMMESENMHQYLTRWQRFAGAISAKANLPGD